MMLKNVRKEKLILLIQILSINMILKIILVRIIANLPLENQQ